MKPLDFLVLYVLLGLTVVFSLWRVHGRRELWALVAWPLYVPSLFVQAAEVDLAPRLARTDAVAAVDEIERALRPTVAAPCARSLEVVREGLVRLEHRSAEIDVLVARLRNESQQPGDVGWRDPILADLIALKAQTQAELERALESAAALAARAHLVRLMGEDSTGLKEELTRLAAAVDAASEVAAVGRTRLSVAVRRQGAS